MNLCSQISVNRDQSVFNRDQLWKSKNSDTVFDFLVLLQVTSCFLQVFITRQTKNNRSAELFQQQPEKYISPDSWITHTHRNPYRIYRLLIRYAFHVGKNTGMCASQIGDKAKLSQRLLYKSKCKLFLFLLVTCVTTVPHQKSAERPNFIFQ